MSKRAMLVFGLMCAIAAACAVDDLTTESEQTICRPDIDDCPGGHPLTESELRGETRRRYGQPTGRLECSAIHVEPGIHYTTCSVSANGLTLFSCTFNYGVSGDGDATIQAVNCG